MFLPNFLYALSQQATIWLVERFQPGVDERLFIALIAAAVILMLFADFRIGLRKFAIIRVLSGDYSDLKSAFSDAERNSFSVFLLILPICAVDLLMTVVVGAASNLLSSGPSTDESQQIWGVILLVISFALVLPYCFVDVLDALWISAVALEKKGFLQAFGRLLQFAFLAPRLFFSAVTLLAIMSAIILAPTAILAIIDELPKLFPGALKDIAEFITSCIQAFFEAIVSGFWTACLAIGSAYIHNEFRMRVEGLDITKKMEALERQQ